MSSGRTKMRSLTASTPTETCEIERVTVPFVLPRSDQRMFLGAQQPQLMIVRIGERYIEEPAVARDVLPQHVTLRVPIARQDGKRENMRRIHGEGIAPRIDSRRKVVRRVPHEKDRLRCGPQILHHVAQEVVELQGFEIVNDAVESQASNDGGSLDPVEACER